MSDKIYVLPMYILFCFIIRFCFIFTCFILKCSLKVFNNTKYNTIQKQKKKESKNDKIKMIAS